MKTETKKVIAKPKIIAPPKEVKPKGKIVVSKDMIEGLQQKFTTKDNKEVSLHSVLSEGDYWQTNGRVKRTILTHDAVKKLADMAGVRMDPEYTVLTQPDAMNNYQYTIQVKICNHKNVCVTEIGEANRSNLGTKGRGNPANMAQKRAYDRAVLRLLGITGLLSAEELSDEETQETMDGLSHEDKKSIAPMVNKLILATTNENLILFGREMKSKASSFKPEQLDYLRKLYRKKVGEITKTKF